MAFKVLIKLNLISLNKGLFHCDFYGDFLKSPMLTPCDFDCNFGATTLQFAAIFPFYWLVNGVKFSILDSSLQAIQKFCSNYSRLFTAVF
jgi:hypothetical protein